MHVTIRKYAGLGRLIDRLAPPVRIGLVPRLRQAPGFRGYCAFASEDGHIVSVTVFGDRQDAIRAEDRLGEWTANNLKDLAPDPPEVTAGETLLHEVSKIERNGGPAMFATMRIYDGVRPKEEILPLVREHVFLTITGAQGFRGYYAFLDERNASRGVSISLFDARDRAMEANERVVSVMHERRIAPKPPSVTAGQTAVSAAA